MRTSRETKSRISFMITCANEPEKYAILGFHFLYNCSPRVSGDVYVFNLSHFSLNLKTSASEKKNINLHLSLIMFVRLSKMQWDESVRLLDC